MFKTKLPVKRRDELELESGVNPCDHNSLGMEVVTVIIVLQFRCTKSERELNSNP